MQRFKLPQNFGSERLDTVLVLLESFKERELITLNVSNVKNIDPAGLAIGAIIYDQACEKNSNLEIINDKNPLLKKFPLPLFKEKLQKGIPKPSFHDLETPKSFHLCCQGGIDLRYKELLQNKFGSILHEDLIFSVQLVFNELIQNAVDHSTSERYYLYFGLAEDEIHFGVLDMGVTLPAKMEQKYNKENDIEYLEFSLQEGVTTRRQRSGGLGLFHTLEMIKEQQGKFVFLSRDAQIRHYFSQRKIQRSKLKARLHGTWVLFTLKARFKT